MPDMWGFAIQPGVGLSTLYTRKRWEYGFAWICKANFGGKKWRCVCGCFVWSCWGSSFGCGPSAHWWCPLLFDFLISGILCVLWSSLHHPAATQVRSVQTIANDSPLRSDYARSFAIRGFRSRDIKSEATKHNLFCLTCLFPLSTDASLSLSVLSNYSDCRLLTLKCVSILFTFVTDMPFFLVRS